MAIDVVRLCPRAVGVKLSDSETKSRGSSTGTDFDDPLDDRTRDAAPEVLGLSGSVLDLVCIKCLKSSLAYRGTRRRRVARGSLMAQRLRINRKVAGVGRGHVP